MRNKKKNYWNTGYLNCVGIQTSVFNKFVLIEILLMYHLNKVETYPDLKLQESSLNIYQ